VGGICYHVINRGNNRHPVFCDDGWRCSPRHVGGAASAHVRQSSDGGHSKEWARKATGLKSWFVDRESSFVVLTNDE